MRIISGKRRGLKLFSPKGDNTRPTESRIKESIFNIIGNVSNTKVLDLFAGSGSIGLEFLSRGSTVSYFVESNKSTIDTLMNNIEKSKLEICKVFPYDYKKALEDISNIDIEFDYVYLDPPYGKINFYNHALKIIHENTLNFKDSIIIVEANADDKIENIDIFDIKDKRKYRDTIVYFLRRK